MFADSRKAHNLMIVIFYVWMLFILTACGTQSTPPPPTSVATATESIAQDLQTTVVTTETTDETSDGIIPGSVEEVATSVAERTPVPTPTPGRVDREISQFVQRTGLEGRTFLGLSVENWINLGISILIILIGYLVGVRLLSEIFRWFTKRTEIKFDDSLVAHISPDLKLLVLLFFTSFAVQRLDFLSDNLRTTLGDIFFALGILLITVVAIRIVNFGTNWYAKKLLTDENRNRLRPLIMMVNRFIIFAILLIGLSVAMSHFGIDIGAIGLILIVTAVIVSIGARNYVSDVVSGFIILVDQPFRVHDGVEIKELDTWGDVLEIGTRTTRIRTRDNREVIVPNSKILDNLVVNFSYPSPDYRMQVDIGIAFGSDLEKARQAIVKALNKVDGVLHDKGVEVLFIGFGDTNRQIRVRWWITDYHKNWVVLDAACTAIESALAEAQIEMPFITYDLNVRMQESHTTQDGTNPEQSSPSEEDEVT